MWFKIKTNMWLYELKSYFSIIFALVETGVIAIFLTCCTYIPTWASAFTCAKVLLSMLVKYSRIVCQN